MIGGYFATARIPKREGCSSEPAVTDRMGILDANRRLEASTVRLARAHLPSPSLRALAYVVLAAVGATIALGVQYAGPCYTRDGPITSTGSGWQLGAAVGGSLASGLFAGLAVQALARRTALRNTALVGALAALAGIAAGIGAAVALFIVALGLFLDRCPPLLS
jgi:hypothetical protein